jgi:hypothetical protein
MLVLDIIKIFATRNRKEFMNPRRSFGIARFLDSFHRLVFRKKRNISESRRRIGRYLLNLTRQIELSYITGPLLSNG